MPLVYPGPPATQAYQRRLFLLQVASQTLSLCCTYCRVLCVCDKLVVSWPHGNSRNVMVLIDLYHTAADCNRSLDMLHALLSILGPPSAGRPF